MEFSNSAHENYGIFIIHLWKPNHYVRFRPFGIQESIDNYGKLLRPTDRSPQAGVLLML